MTTYLAVNIIDIGNIVASTAKRDGRDFESVP
jgi:hypothetical protein